MPRINRNLKQQQHGQALVEYGIILVLLVTLVLGAAELGIAAFNSSKTSDTARTGANEFANTTSASKSATFNVAELEIFLNSAESGDIEANVGTADNTEDFLPIPDQDGDMDVDRADYLLKLASLGLDGADGSTPDGTTTKAEVESGGNINRLKGLLLLTELAPVLADHDPVSNTGIAMATCLPGDTYDDGLPDRYVDATDYPSVANINDGDADGDGAVDNNKIYLFNILPIDFASCAGDDASRGGRSRVSILVNGYKDSADPALNIPGLPKLNQAMFSQYSKVCIAGGVYVDCNQGSAPNSILKPPGKLCLSSAPGTEGCPTEINDPLAPIAGYYFFGQSIDNFTPIPNANDFRPTFQIVCDGTGAEYQTNAIMVNCENPDTASKITVHTRYRAIFESFLTFGLYKLPDNTLLPYFYNPGGVDANGNRFIAAVGGEIGTASKEGDSLLNTVKKFRDFRGCYSVNTQTNQVSACN